MRKLLLLLLMGLAVTGRPTSVLASDLKLEARLIRAANDDKEAGKFAPLDPALCDKLHRNFKWKYYFEITNQTASIPLYQASDLKMSDTCVLHVRNLGGSRVEVGCIGHGKEVVKGSYTLVPPQWLVIGGPETAETAWFVGLKDAAKTAPEPARTVTKNP